MRHLDQFLWVVLLSVITLLLLGLWSEGWPKHLLHKLPKDVGEQILLECQGEFNGAFSQGWCADRRAEEWAEQHDTGTKAKAGGSPDLLVKPPDIIIRPPESPQ